MVEAQEVERSLPKPEIKVRFQKWAFQSLKMSCIERTNIGKEGAQSSAGLVVIEEYSRLRDCEFKTQDRIILYI